MFPTQITLTIGGTAKVFNRVNQDNYSSEYRYSGELDAAKLLIRHTTDSVDSDGIRMARHNVFVEHVIYPTATTLMIKSTFSAVMRGGSMQGPSNREALANAMLEWLESPDVISNLAAGVN